MIAYRYRLLMFKIIMSRSSTVPLLVLSFGIIAFYLVNWQFLIDVNTEIMRFILDVLGYKVKFLTGVICIEGQTFQITALCTYVDWLLIATPLVSSCSSFMWKNFLMVVALVVLWFLVNVARIWFAISMICKGYGWWISHDLPDYLLWYFTLAILFYFWLKKRTRIIFKK